jgi:hypothetical protein
MQIALLAVIGLVVFQDARAANCMQCGTITTIMEDGADAGTLKTAIDLLGYFSDVNDMDDCPMEKTACPNGDEYCVAFSTMVKHTDAAGTSMVTQVVDVMGCQEDVLDCLEGIQQALTEADAPLDWSTEEDGMATCEAIKAVICEDLDMTLDDGTIQTAAEECTVMCGDADDFMAYSRIQTVEITMTYTTVTGARRAKRAEGDPFTVADSYTGDMDTACAAIEGFLYSSLTVAEGAYADPNDAAPASYIFSFMLYFTDAVTVNQAAIITAVDGIVTTDTNAQSSQTAVFDDATGITVVPSPQQDCDADAECQPEAKDGAARNSVASFVLASALIAAL